jgi:hypothetical protein
MNAKLANILTAIDMSVAHGLEHAANWLVRQCPEHFSTPTEASAAMAAVQGGQGQDETPVTPPADPVPATPASPAISHPGIEPSQDSAIS